jgi:hypothetical protein
MRLNGNLTVIGRINQLKLELVSSDPASPLQARLWYNTTDNCIKYYDGAAVQEIAKGGNLNDYLRLDGTTPMTGAITLSSADQTGAAATVATAKGYVDTGLATKEPNLNGAATSVAQANLAVSRVVVSDALGKIAASSNATAAEVEHLAGVTSSIQTQIESKEPLIGYVPVNKAGDTMTGNLAMSNNHVTGLAPASGPTEPVRQAEFEAALAGLDFQPDVLGRQLDATFTVTGHTAGDRYIIANSTALHASFGTIPSVANGDIVVSNGTSFTVTYDVSVKGEGAICWNRGSDTFNFYNGTEWADFGGLAGVTAGVGLAKNGNDIYVNMGAGIAQLPTDEVGIALRALSGLMLSTDGTTPSTDTAAALMAHVDNATIELDAAGTRVKAAGINQTHINASSLTNGLLGGSGVAIGVKTAAASGITVDATGVSVDNTEMRTRVIYRDGAQAMTGVLHLSSNDQSAETAVSAISKGHLDATVATIGTAATALTNRLVAGYFVYDGTGAAATSHTVTHNMGNKFVQVTVLDASDDVIIPESIHFTDANSLAVTFTSAETCRVVVTGLKAAA